MLYNEILPAEIWLNSGDMAVQMQKKRRLASKQKAIFERIRDHIVSGRLSPGERLPNRADLEKRFDASPATLQNAFHALIEEGFVTPAGRKGTFVAQHPPHLSRYALLFESARGKPDWSNYHTALLNEAAVIETQAHRRIVPYFDMRSAPVSRDYAMLLDDLAEKRVAGILATSKDSLPHALFPKMENTPCVALNATPFHPGIQTVKFGGPHGFIEPALDHLIARGRLRVAFVLATGMNPERESQIMELLRSRGIAANPRWIQCIHPAEARWAANLAWLFFSIESNLRPDGVVIMDDNLVECFCAGLVAAGVRVPAEVEIVAHCNFPYPVPGVLPITRLGYDLHGVLSHGLTMIDRRRKGEALESHTVVRPCFESEYIRNRDASTEIHTIPALEKVGTKEEEEMVPRNGLEPLTPRSTIAPV